MENLEFYEKLRAVPTEAQKPFNNGRFSGTDINPMWRIKKMTELFGACGIGWYYEVAQREIKVSDDGKQGVVFMAVNLYIKQDGEWSKPIYGEGGNRFISGSTLDDDCYKKALTDAVSNATKQLGLGADVWFERDKQDGTKYDAAKPVELTPQQRRLVAQDYLKNNQKAMAHFCNLYKAEKVYDFTAEQLENIYAVLRNNGKV